MKSKGPAIAENTARRYKLVVAYDGTNYQGWQLQNVGLGVQQLVESALAQIYPSRPQVHSSSRTDTGVHAVGMAAHFDVPKAEDRMTAHKILLALNAHLPEDIRLQTVTSVRPDFHARFDARGKEYRYFIWNHSGMNPLLRHQAWHVPKALDLEAMRQAGKLLCGKHDFKSFAAKRPNAPTMTVRKVARCDVRATGPLLTVVIEADGFLYKMCRGFVGTLVQVGLGKIRPEEICRILESKDRRVAGMTAPAHGLTLWKVFYKYRRDAKITSNEEDEE